MKIKNLKSKIIVSAAGFAASAALDEVAPRKTASNPTKFRLMAIVVFYVAWEFIEPAIERKLGLTAKD